MNDVAAQLAQIDSLETGKSLKHLLNEAHRIIGNPFVLFNMEYKLLAHTENIVTDDWLWHEIVDTGAYSEESIKLFLDENFIDTVASAKKIVLLTSDKLQNERLYGRIFNGYGSTVADLIMAACCRPLVEQDWVVFEALRDKISQKISACDFYRHYGVLYHETLICQLLNNNIGDKVIYSDHLANLYEGLETNLYVAVADLSRCNAPDMGAGAFRDVCKKTQPECKYAAYANYVVILVGTENTAFHADREFRKLGILFERYNIYAGVSRRFENLYDLLKHYQEAVDVTARGMETDSGRRIFL